MKNLLYIFPSLRISGAEKSAILIANKLVETNKFDICFFVLEDVIEQRELINPKIKIKECKVSFINKSKLKRITYTYLYFPYILWKFLRINNFNYVISVYEYFSEWAIIFAKIFNTKEVKYISIIQNSIKQTKKNSKLARKILFIFIDLLRNICFNRIIIVANYLFEEIKLFDKNKIVWIPNPINFVMVLKDSNVLDNYKNYDLHKKKYFLNIGRICTQKNQSLLIEAFLKIVNDIDWKLVVVGNIQDKKIFTYLKERLLQVNAEHKVIFFEKYENIYNLLKNAGAYICTSKYEGLSLAILESMVLKTPIISTKYLGYKEVLNSDNSYLIDEPKSNILAMKMLSFAMEKINFSLKVNLAYKTVSTNYDLEIISKKYIELL